MEAITKYKANDGSEWNSEKQCEAREEMILEVGNIMSILNPRPKECGWSGYVQQYSAKINEVKERLFDLINQDGVLKWWIDEQKEKHLKTHLDLIHYTHVSWFLRMLDGGNRPIERAYNRLYCIDDACREWEQPYYAINPGTGEDRCVKP